MDPLEVLGAGAVCAAFFVALRTYEDKKEFEHRKDRVSPSEREQALKAALTVGVMVFVPFALVAAGLMFF